jgi:hypothetical protein
VCPSAQLPEATRKSDNPKETALIDLATLDTRTAADQGQVMEIIHPQTGEVMRQDNGEPVTITLAGRDSDRVKRLERANRDRMIKAGSRRGTSGITADDLDRQTVERLVAATIAWSGIMLDGELIECNSANARRLYERVDFVREDADAFITDRANFLKASSAS